MKFDLKKMNRKDLEKLARDVDKALEKLRKQDIKKLRSEMEKLAASHGVSVEDVMGGTARAKVSAKKAPKAKSAPKFANPANPAQTWTGKGRQPDWFKSAVAAGTSPDSMAI